MSVEIGLNLGADIVEEDVRVTKDGIPVLAHDDF
ncbi:glycerophosphodiester phosphodiesterase family protein [Paenibacillus andongensis]|nr:glycerophosphodiester phosphodiesterase family protein [Paenibacillus andongensis]